MGSVATDKKSVCIIGGGPSGLSTLRRVLDSPILTGTLFEQKDDIGGLWNFSGNKQFATSPKNLTTPEDMECDPECVTAMYDNLITNAPYPLMQMLGFSHTDSQTKGTFATQKEMHQYLRDYATHFNLWPHIQVNTAATNIRPEDPSAPEGEPVRWTVESHNHVKNETTTEIYDAVITCTGKHTYPVDTKIPGLESFKGTVTHSKYFRNELDYAGKRVVLIGLGGSSADIGLQLSKAPGCTVIVSHRHPYGYKYGLMPRNGREVKSVKAVTPDGVVIEDGEEIPCDAIILCTGYNLKFPFLHPECGLEVIKGKYVPHLYNMTVFTKRPSLAIFNMCYRCPEIVLTEFQARYFVHLLEGKHQLPSYEEMEVAIRVEEEEKREKGMPYALWHEVGPLGIHSWELFRRLAKEGGFEEDCKDFKILECLWNTNYQRVFGSWALHKGETLRRVDDVTWEYIFNTNPEYPNHKAEKLTVIQNPDDTISVKRTEL